MPPAVGGAGDGRRRQEGTRDTGPAVASCGADCGCSMAPAVHYGNGEDAAADDDSCVMLQILQDMIPAYTENGPTGRTSFIRDGITEGQKDVAQEGFNLGHRQSAHVGYKWGLVQGITSALASLPASLKEKLLLDAQRRGKLEGLHNSVQEISAQGALQLFHESTLQDSRRPEESKLQTITKDLLLLLHECPDVHVSEEVKRVP